MAKKTGRPRVTSQPAFEPETINGITVRSAKQKGVLDRMTIEDMRKHADDPEVAAVLAQIDQRAEAQAASREPYHGKSARAEDRYGFARAFSDSLEG